MTRKRGVKGEEMRCERFTCTSFLVVDLGVDNEPEHISIVSSIDFVSLRP